MSRGLVEFRNVSFGYGKRQNEAVLHDISFTAKPGQTIGIIGSTGSGKTSLVQLIPRLYDVTAGQVLVDGVDVREYSLKHLRDGVAMVLQKNVLFAGTIEDNLRWGGEEATREEIRAREEQGNVEAMAALLEAGPDQSCEGMVEALEERGFSPRQVAAAALSLCFPQRELPADIHSQINRQSRREADRTGAKGVPAAYTEVVVDIGSANGVETKHLVGAITERSGLSGREVGKIHILPDYSVVAVPADRAGDVVESMLGCKICGRPTQTVRLAGTERAKSRPARPGSKAARFAAERIEKRQLAQRGGPARRKKKIPDFEG